MVFVAVVGYMTDYTVGMAEVLLDLIFEVFHMVYDRVSEVEEGTAAVVVFETKDYPVGQCRTNRRLSWASAADSHS